MNKHFLPQILCLLILSAVTSCSEWFDPLLSTDDASILAGDEVQFSARVPQVATRSAKDDYYALINRFERVQDDYAFEVSMYEEEASGRIASASYIPTKHTTLDATAYDEYGTLTEATAPMHWPSNLKKYAFHAESASTSAQVEPDQTTFEKYFAQDRIEGYGYVPGWDDTLNEGAGAPIRNLNALNYLTAKEWYAANKAWGVPLDEESNPLSDNALIEHWKKIPLFMHHKRSRITIRLRAGEGVEREQIAYNQYTEEHISTKIYSYDADGNQTVVSPLLSNYPCEYEATNLLPKETVTTACYDAIVNPHDYADGTNMTEQKILAINLSGMKFSFCAANDAAYSSAPEAKNADIKARYNLTEGKHLILDVVLSTDTRKILITAYVCEWEDWPFSSICDDFGQASDPMPINNKEELIEFLTNPEKNKGGNVGVIMPLDFNLNSEGGWDPADYELKATLKLAGATITTNQRLLDKIASSGSIINGSVVIADKDNADTPLECAIARENYGTIERINVRQGATSRKATRGGLVTTNYGTIYACSSQMPVYNAGGGSEVLIGGIAAEMLHPMKDDGAGHMTADLSVMPTIDQCYVNARVDGGENVKGGGIVGKAEGRLTCNTYEYGITLLQDHARFKNILYAKATQDLSIYDNEWPTKVDNVVLNGNPLSNHRPDASLYSHVLDSQAELHALITNSTYNQKNNRFRIADSFTVSGDSWDHGLQNQATTASKGNLHCELNCNSKTITLTGTTHAQMLLSNILGHIYDLTLVLDKPIEALPNSSAESEAERLPARAPLAYAVLGEGGKLTRIAVKSASEAYVQSTASGGLVVWAYDGATLEDCSSDVDVRIALPDNTGSQQTYFVGGLVCSAAKASIQRCTYLRDNFNSSEENYATSSSNIYYGGIVGGTNTKTEATHHPELNISDCVSWLTWSTSTGDHPHSAWGGIIGYSKYQGLQTGLVTSMDGHCQGNWWAAQYGASPQGWALGMNEEKVIGKKNSVRPTK